MILPADIRRWDAEWTYRRQEREAIMQFDGGLDELEVKRRAIEDTRRVAEQEGI